MVERENVTSAWAGLMSALVIRGLGIYAVWRVWTMIFRLDVLSPK